MRSRTYTTAISLVVGFVMFMMIALPAISDSNDGRFVLRDGSRSMTGNLDLGGNTIKNIGAGLTFDSADIDGGTIDGTVIGGIAPGAGTFTTLNASGGGSLTGTWSDLGSVTTVDINGGTVDGATIGGATPGAGTFTTLNASGGGSLTGTWSDLGSVTTVDINGGTVDGATIGASAAGAGTFTTMTVDNTTLNADTFTSTGRLAFTIADTNEFVINDVSNNDVDFRVESGLDDHALFLDGSTGLTSVRTVAGVPNTFTVDAQGNQASIRLAADTTSVSSAVGDASVIFANNGSDVWSVGLDDNQSDGLAISESGTVGSNLRLWLSGGNVGVSTTALPNGTGTLVFADGGAPTSLGADTAGIYANDVAGITEMFAIDEGGTATQLSAHPSGILDNSSLLCQMHPGATVSTNPYIGKEVIIDWCQVLLALEALTGLDLMKFQAIPATERRDWDTDQETLFQKRQAERAKAQADHAAIWAAYLAETDPNIKAALLAEYDSIVVPPRYKKQRPPKWMVDRGAVTALP